ncbi:hypothetical protein ACD591_05445 [Rufibacter glacialis]|uniref:Uncharacterized protein n=1 Tax=Rufibacter glacialis TaxID=1259555 RepID=A0A5M8QFL5_9BACT|nr:hypothetical protein [Rufibacter glacialis]KAA6434789.1 hypothetical protein FOE74_11500 [Rufibacter glacialis]GGK72444.1 hypothetical protein GCM10011405_20850 [Rufibacter glacialis]
MEKKEITIRIDKVESNEATQSARELRSYLKSEIEELQIDIKKEATDTMDFGATLVLILGAPVLVELAKGIADFIRAYGSKAEFTIECNGKSIIFKGGTEDAAKIAESLKEICAPSAT